MSAPPRRQKHRRQRRSANKAAAAAAIEASTSGTNSDTVSASSRARLINTRKSTRDNGAGSGNGTLEGARPEYVYIPSEGGERLTESTRAYLNEGFNTARVGAGK